MTTKEFNKAFEYDFKDVPNERVFENEDIKVTVKKENSDSYRVNISWFFEDIADDDFQADLEKIVRLINEKNLELQDYSDDQKFEIKLDALVESMSDDDLNPIKETSYTCKNGYIMQVFLIEEWFFDSFPKFNQYYLEKKVKDLRGWYDYKQKGIILRSRKDAQTIVKFINDNNFKPIDSKLRRTYPYHS